MADMMKSAAAWVESKRLAALSSSVTYSRGTNSITLDATRARSVFEQVESDGTITRLETADWIVGTTDMTLGVPAVDDTIVQTEGTTAYTFTVMSPGGEPPWRWSDVLGRTSLRIHTKLTKQETTP